MTEIPPGRWCADCGHHRVEDPWRWLCPVCADRLPAPTPAGDPVDEAERLITTCRYYPVINAPDTFLVITDITGT